VLAAIVVEPRHGWDVTKWLNERMAPTWSTDRRRVYDELKRLEADRLAWSEVVFDDEAPNGTKRIFYPTKRGIEVCEELLRGSGSQAQRTLADLYAWMLLSRPEEAPKILADLEEMERDCMEKAEADVEACHAATWADRMVSQRQAVPREEHRFELRCIKRAIREIEEYLAGQQ
jgi:DNA-binding PadR family transcriptional regulator